MALNETKVCLIVGADDALLLRAHLRGERIRFAEHDNEVMTGIFDRMEKAFESAKPAEGPTVWDILRHPEV
jgi:hypothetical protein